MSFVTTRPEALLAAASKLETIGSAMAAQNAAAAATTTGVIPAAADQVSVLQASLFSAYGHLYQHISANAKVINEMIVKTLDTSADSYDASETANSAAADSSGSGLGGLLGSLFGSSSSSSSSSLTGILGNTGPLGLSGSLGNMTNIGIGNFAAGFSDMLALAGGGLLDAPAAGVADLGGLAGISGAALAGEVGPAGPAGFGAMPVSAAVSQASSIGGLSVPPSWAGEVVPASSTAPTTLAGAGSTTAAPQSTPVATMPAGMPSVASAGRGGFGFGAPRYGVKPIVMPKPAVG
ncbi:PE domain-containing protein [Mycobacterium sp.]|uniref:PPE family protein, SVP subgroup n=1 Tax=Mycobacterium sp. TaxID=1785 RepID=UPI0031E204BC